jgi:hypothetical protein
MSKKKHQPTVTDTATTIKPGGYSPPYNRLFVGNKMGVLLGKQQNRYTYTEHYHARYSTDITLVSAVVTKDPEAFTAAYKEICGRDLPTDIGRLTVVWVPIGHKFRIYWDDEECEEYIQDYEPVEWIVA